MRCCWSSFWIVIVSFSGMSQDMELYRAREHGTLAKVNYRVVDDRYRCACRQCDGSCDI